MRTHGHTHGGRPTPEYGAWQRMWSRVRGSANANSKKNYVERGIGVDATWESFEQFLKDMGPRPPGTWLDRKENDRGYEPSNCRWATPTEQQRNRRSNRLLTHAGQTMCMAAWEDRLGFRRGIVKQRLRRGWSVDEALTTRR